MKAIVQKVDSMSYGDPHRIIAWIGFEDGTDIVEATTPVEVSLDGVTDGKSLEAAVRAAVLDYANNTQSYGIADSDIYYSFPTGNRAELVTGTVSGGAGAVSINITAEAFASVEHVIWEAEDDTTLYSFGSLSNSTSVVSCVVKKQVFTSGNALLNLLGGLISVLTGVSQTAAPNGTQVRALVIGR